MERKESKVKILNLEVPGDNCTHEADKVTFSMRTIERADCCKPESMRDGLLFHDTRRLRKIRINRHNNIKMHRQRINKIIESCYSL